MAGERLIAGTVAASVIAMGLISLRVMQRCGYSSTEASAQAKPRRARKNL